MQTPARKRLSFCAMFLLLSIAIYGCSGGTESNYALADNPAGPNSENNPTFSIPTAGVPAVGALTVTAYPDKMELKWQDTSPSEDGFKIMKDGITAGETPRNIAVWTDTQILPGTTYCYKIIPYNREYAQGIVSREECATIPVPITSPAAPSNFTASAASDGITLSWSDNSNNENGFRIARNGVLIQTLPANATSYKDTTAGVGTAYCYTASAFNDGGANSSVQECATIPVPNQVPTVSIVYPTAGELAYKLTRVKINWLDQDDQYLTLRIFIDGTEQVNIEVETASYSKWFDIDFTDYPDGDYTISAEVYDSHGAMKSVMTQARVNQAEVEDKAMQFLYLQSTITCANPETFKCIVRWLEPAHIVEVSPLFTNEQFQMIKDAAAFLTRYTSIPFEVRWSSLETFGPNPNCYDLPVDINFIFIYPENYSEATLAKTCAPRDIATGYTTVSKAVIMVQNTALNQFAGQPETLAFIYAHEIAHTLPIINHESARYLMYPYLNDSYRFSPEMARAMEMLYYNFAPGDQIPTPAHFTIGYISSW